MQSLVQQRPSSAQDDEWQQEVEDHACRILSQYRVETHVNHTPPDVASCSLRLSADVLECLQSLGLNPKELLQVPSIQTSPVDDSHPIEHYFISSSHNTYLLGRQLIGRSSAAVYKHVLTNGARCVEIDVWPSHNGPVVTHGHTFSQSVHFADVCKAIGDALADEDWPVMVSLECHVGVDGQPEMIQIMEQTWKEKLVHHEVHGLDVESVTPQILKGKILLMVEYYPPDDESLESKLASSSLDESDAEERAPQSAQSKISNALAALGPYARSMKPKKSWLIDHETFHAPILVNISETGISSLMPHSLDLLIAHARQHLRRVYPKGTRVTSDNQDPVAQWRNGSHIVCLNWQKYDAGMQMNEALFVGTPGWVLKPPHMLLREQDSAPKPQRMRLVGEIAGVSSLPCPPDAHHHLSAYVRVELLHTEKTHEWKSKSTKGQAGDLASSGVPAAGALGVVDITWDQRFEFDYDYDELAFLRLLFEEDELTRDGKLAVFCARLEHIQQGWRLVRLLDMQGRASGATALVKFTIEAI